MDFLAEDSGETRRRLTTRLFLTTLWPTTLYEWRQKAAVKAKKLARAEQEGVSQVERG
jgi:hypothetical protein